MELYFYGYLYYSTIKPQRKTYCNNGKKNKQEQSRTSRSMPFYNRCGTALVKEIINQRHSVREMNHRHELSLCNLTFVRRTDTVH